MFMIETGGWYIPKRNDEHQSDICQERRRKYFLDLGLDFLNTAGKGIWRKTNQRGLSFEQLLTEMGIGSGWSFVISHVSINDRDIIWERDECP